jgi:hypothetical protein
MDVRDHSFLFFLRKRFVRSLSRSRSDSRSNTLARFISLYPLFLDLPSLPPHPVTPSLSFSLRLAPPLPPSRLHRPFSLLEGAY